MLPKVLIHNSISLDGSLINFDVNMGLHYQLAGKFKPDMHLIGSKTIKTGLEIYGGESTPENRNDFIKPFRNEVLPFWVIIDTQGTLIDQLHAIRRFEFCRDVVVLISKSSPKEYIYYLKERNYDFFQVGERLVDLKKALKLLSEKYKAKTVLADTGSILSNLLLDQGLVDEISLLVHPVIVGNNAENIFGRSRFKDLILKKSEVLEKKYIWLIYEVN